MRKTDHHFNTDEQVEDYTRRALALVEKVDPPDDLRAAAFTAAFTALSGKQVVFEQVSPLGIPGMTIPRG